jgi:hypothetical protein
VLTFGDGGHFSRQGQRVRLMLKKWIRHHFHFMEMHALVQLGEPGGQRGRNKMNIVTAFGQFFSELRADNPTPAVSWIDSDADVHYRSVVSCQLSVAGPSIYCNA